MIRLLVEYLSKRSRNKRKTIFQKYMIPCKEDKILDLGSQNGHYISSITPYRNGVYIADIVISPLLDGKKKYGFHSILFPENSYFPIRDKCFDIVHCSSVIEHATVSKNNLASYRKSREFHSIAFQQQKKFADEIKRIAKNYFVQTPNKYFIIESHTWLPLINILPRHILIITISLLNKFWVKKTSADWNLLSANDLNELFPDAKIIKEKFLFMTKSLMAIKSDRIDT